MQAIDPSVKNISNYLYYRFNITSYPLYTECLLINYCALLISNLP